MKVRINIMATKKIVISEKHYMTLHTKMMSACRTLERVDGIYDEIDDMYKQLKQLYVNEDKNKNLVDSIREIKVNDVDSDDEKKDESAIREQIENLVKAIIDGDVARSNHIEWEIMQNTVNDKKKIRKC